MAAEGHQDREMTDVPIIIHLLGVVTPLAITATFFNGNLFSAHVFLMSVTYLFVIPEGIIMAVKAVRVCPEALILAIDRFLHKTL